MRIEYIGKTPAKVDAITPQAEKRGQTDSVPAVCVTLTSRVSGDKLAMFDKKLHGFIFRKARQDEIEQENLDGEAQWKLTDAAKAIGALSWSGEQSGSKLKIYWGIATEPHVQLVDVVLDKVRISPEENNVVEIRFNAYTATGIDEETMGRLGVLKAAELDIEVIPPEIVKPSKDLVDQANEKIKRQTPADALAAALGHDNLATAH